MLKYSTLIKFVVTPAYLYISILIPREKPGGCIQATILNPNGPNMALNPVFNKQA